MAGGARPLTNHSPFDTMCGSAEFIREELNVSSKKRSEPDAVTVLKVRAADSVVVSDSLTTVVTSGTAFVPLEGQPGAMQPVVIPRLEIGPQRFREEFAKIRTFVQETAMDGTPDQPGFYVDQIELHLDVTAEGGLRVLGSGIDASAAAGIKVVFKRGKPRRS